MFQIKVVVKIKTHILCSVTFFFEIRAVYKIMSKNAVEPEKPQAIWRLLVACWKNEVARVQAQASARGPTLTGADKRTHNNSLTHTHIEICNTYCLSTATMLS